jgi:preprotein translocase subunit SecD
MATPKKSTVVEPLNYELPTTPDLVIDKVASLKTIVHSQTGIKMVSVQIKLLPEDTAKFATLTGSHIDDRMMICVDKKVIVQPVIKMKITSGIFAIPMQSGTKKEAKALIRRIKDKKLELYIIKK